jgi:hypothetical protein
MIRSARRVRGSRMFAIAAFLAALAANAPVTTVANAAVILSAEPGRQGADDLGSIVELYRGGGYDRAVVRLSEMVAAKPSDDEAALAWIRDARRAGRQAELEAALMLYTEAAIATWVRSDVYPQGAIARYVPKLTRLVDALKSIDPRSPFLRGWYLLWESFRQSYVQPLSELLDFLGDALAAFGDDASVQLAAGSRHELTWWLTSDNPRRDPRASNPAARRALTAARDRYRKSLALDPREDEARLRLLRVSLELNELDAAEGLVAGFEWPAGNPVVLYLARLFEGALRERQGDRVAAARLYDLAIAQTPQAQSARIAKAHLAHASGSRAAAVAVAIEAMSSTSTANDPWWVYTKGQVWHFDAYLKRQRELVRR